MLKRAVSFPTIKLMLFAVCLLAAYSAFAQKEKGKDTPEKEKTRWEYHKSISGAFDARFPSNYKIKSSPLRIDNTTVLFRVEVFAEIEDDENPNAPKRNYSIKVDQTLGSVIGASKTQDLLARDVFKYKKATRALGAKLESQQDVNSDGFVGKEFLFNFTQNGAEQGLRVKVMYTDVSRVEAVLAGPQASMYSFKANEFFNSLKLYDGYAKIDGKIGEGWTEYESPLGLFSVVLPDEKNTYSVGAPKFIVGDKKEQGRFYFKDPVLSQRTIFNFYGYQIQQEKKFDDVKVLLYAEHVSKYLSNFRLQDLKFDERMSPDDSYGILSTKIKVRGLEKHPYITSIIIQALFNKDGVVVLEYMGTNEQVNAPLGKTLFSMVKFHPEKSYQKERPSAGENSSNPSKGPESLEHDQEDQDEETEPSQDSSDEDKAGSGDARDGSTDPGNTDDKQTLKASIKLGGTEPSEEQEAKEAVAPDLKAEISPAPQKQEKDVIAPAPTSVDPKAIKIDLGPSANDSSPPDIQFGSTKQKSEESQTTP